MHSCTCNHRLECLSDSLYNLCCAFQHRPSQGLLTMRLILQLFTSVASKVGIMPWIFLFYKVCSPTPWPFIKFLKYSKFSHSLILSFQWRAALCGLSWWFPECPMNLNISPSNIYIFAHWFPILNYILPCSSWEYLLIPMVSTVTRGVPKFSDDLIILFIVSFPSYRFFALHRR